MLTLLRVINKLIQYLTYLIEREMSIGPINFDNKSVNKKDMGIYTGDYPSSVDYTPFNDRPENNKSISLKIKSNLYLVSQEFELTDKFLDEFFIHPLDYHFVFEFLTPELKIRIRDFCNTNKVGDSIAPPTSPRHKEKELKDLESKLDSILDLHDQNKKVIAEKIIVTDSKIEFHALDSISKLLKNQEKEINKIVEHQELTDLGYVSNNVTRVIDLMDDLNPGSISKHQAMILLVNIYGMSPKAANSLIEDITS